MLTPTCPSVWDMDMPRRRSISNREVMRWWIEIERDIGVPHRRTLSSAPTPLRYLSFRASHSSLLLSALRRTGLGPRSSLPAR